MMLLNCTLYSLKNVYHSAQGCYFLDQKLNKVVEQEAIDWSGIQFGIVCCNEATVTAVRLLSPASVLKSPPSEGVLFVLNEYA